MTCKCDLRTRAVGDGCKYCNPQDYIDKLEAQSTDDRAELDAQQSEIERLKSQRDRLIHTLKNTNELLDPFDYKIELVKNNALIAEIEAEK